MKKIFLLLILSIISLHCFSQSYSYVKVADKPIYEKYLIYCNKLVLDTVYMVGYKKVPLLSVTYVYNRTIILSDGTTYIRKKGTYMTQEIVFSSNRYNNQYRKKKYKNVPVSQPALPSLTAGKELHFVPIVYYCLQRKPSIRDFYTWYYTLEIKPE